MNAYGKAVENLYLKTGENVISTAALSPGIYFIMVLDEATKLSTTHKITKL
jgi:hypothetical protein